RTYLLKDIRIHEKTDILQEAWEEQALLADSEKQETEQVIFSNRLKENPFIRALTGLGIKEKKVSEFIEQLPLGSIALYGQTIALSSIGIWKALKNVFGFEQAKSIAERIVCSKDAQRVEMTTFGTSVPITGELGSVSGNMENQENSLTFAAI